MFEPGPPVTLLRYWWLGKLSVYWSLN